MSRPLRWGILGTGNIAAQFCDGVRGARRSALAAVGSRRAETAAAFARRFEVPRALGSYEALLADAAVDAVYVSLPNSMHHEWTIRALEAGKHVLCEKPFALSAQQAEEMFDAARRAGRLLVEAFMYRSHPLTRAVQRAVADGAIGELKLIRTSFCYRTTRIAQNIRFDPALGGGALMDIGCYCIDFARLFAGQEPVAVHGVGHLHERGVDEYVAGVLRYGNGIVSSFTCGMSVQADNTAYLCGSEGYIEVPVPWKPPAQGAVYIVARATPPRMDAPPGQKPAAPPRQVHRVDAPMPLYGLEADDFAAAVLDGAAPAVTAAETLSNMRLLDALRRQIA